MTRTLFSTVTVLLCITALATATTYTADEMLKGLRVYNVTLPTTLKPGNSNWRVWGPRMLTTRLFNVPLASGNLLVGWTDASGNGHVSHLTRNGTAGYALARDVTIAGRQLRGLAAADDTSFAVLGWVQAGTRGDASKMYVQKWTAAEGTDAAPSRVWETELVAGTNYPSDFGIGDSRMNYGAGEYRAYYHVHSQSGHEGDAYFRVDAASGAATAVWTWGCSHSMSNLLSHHPVLNATVSLCVTDCYPGTKGGNFATDSIGGLYTDGRSLLQVMNAGCNGAVAGEIGMIAPVHNDSWAVIFNSHQRRSQTGQRTYSTKTHNQDVAVAFIDSARTLAGPVKWLTHTRADEADPGLARYGAFCSRATCGAFGQRDHVLLAGWKRGSDRFLAFLRSSGDVGAGPFNVTRLALDGVDTAVSWGARDDTWRTLGDGSVAWLDAPNDSGDVLRVFVLAYDAGVVRKVNTLFSPFEIAVLVVVFGVFPLYVIIMFSVVAIIKRKRGESICGSSSSASGGASSKPDASYAAPEPAPKPAPRPAPTQPGRAAPPPPSRDAPPKTPPRSGGRTKVVRD